MTAPGMQGGETVFKTMGLTGKVRWRERYVELRVISVLLLRDRERGGNCSNGRSIDAEK